jgi:predicted nucleotidyltransferase component of viral defense system
MKKPATNIAASVHQRLLNLRDQGAASFDYLQTRFVLERLLYRLSRSKHSDQFILKGAMLFAVWTNETVRPTRDLDLLGFGDDSSERLARVFVDICETLVEPDGLEFDPTTVRSDDIREGQEYSGQRVTFLARLGSARIHVQIDIGFGDIVSPTAEAIDFPTLLDFPAPRVRAYPRETVVAEKFHAMVDLGMQNSRMKDFYDVFVLSQMFEFSAVRLGAALKATFERRQSALPTAAPLALSDEFACDSMKQTQWSAFIRKSQLSVAPKDLVTVINAIRLFLAPLLTADARLANKVNGHWPAAGPWK